MLPMTQEQRLVNAKEQREKFDRFALAAASKHTLAMMHQRLSERFPEPDDQLAQALDLVDNAVLALQIWLDQQSEELTH